MLFRAIWVGLSLLCSTAYAATQVDLGVIYNPKDAQQKAAFQGVQLALTQVQADRKSEYKFALVNSDFKDAPVIINLSGHENNIKDKVLISTYPQNTFPPMFFSVAASHPVLAAAAAQFIFNQLHRERAIILFQNTHDSKAFADYFDTAYKHIKGKVDLNTTIDVPEMSGLLEQIHAARGKVIYLAADTTQVIRYIRQLRQAGVKLPIIVSADLSSSNLATQFDKTWADGVFYATQAYFDSNFETDEMESFLKQYRIQYKTSPKSIDSVLGYDAAKLAMAAIQDANSVDPQKIASAIMRMKSFPAASGIMNYTRKPSIKAVTIVKLTTGNGNIAAISIPRSI